MGYVTEWKLAADFACRKCGKKNVWYREWESSDGAHDDLHYSCEACKREWWVEGPDY